MKSNGETQGNIPKHRIKPPYNAEEIKLLSSYTISGLKKLKDVGYDVNFEEMCDEIMTLPDSLLALEWSSYWEYWKKRFQNKKTREDRNKTFDECIVDLIAKGILSRTDKITGLTGVFDIRIMNLVNFEQ